MAYKAIEDAGGWKARTAMEDMDLAVWASLKGWKYVFIGDLEVTSLLLGETSCPLCILLCKEKNSTRDHHFYCVIFPVSIMVPEVKLLKPIAIYFPATITVQNLACTLR
ncbi:putative glucomannan 4-beta-mannosyltransferase [Helianthus annuus]|nr:putative glucomannan 4-beta-mannosyltransferase [Helianthus annuus]KAJ0711475.1 putative glucomannan 4-beta-mannosyltransferase [Helianthus annuus]